jgi:hypothetical protein
MANKYYRRPFVVEAEKLIADDLPRIAKWCNGRVKGNSITFARIRDKSKVLDSKDRRAYAVLGQVLVKTAKGFVVMNGDEFDAKFAPVKEDDKKDEVAV